MSKRIIVDPITRIEGHLRIEVVVDDDNVITDAFSSSTLWRGIEVILKGRDPRDAGFLAGRICGVCTYSHYKAGITAVENALGIKVPYNAQLVRSLMNMALFLHDHVVHFYALHGLDWCDIVSALSASPSKASKLAFEYSQNPIVTGENDLIAVQKRVKDFVAKGALGPFNNGYWGHPTYHLSPEQNLIVLSHYLKLLEVQREAAKLLAIFGGKQPHPQSLTVGGITSVMDMLDPSRLAEYKFKFEVVADFINRAYYPDLIMAGRTFNTEQSVLHGVGLKNFLSYEEIQLGRDEYLLDSGIVLNGDISKVLKVDENLIKEEVTNSWYEYQNTSEVQLHPYEGQTNPKYTGFVDGESIGLSGNNEKSKLLQTDSKYSWIKSPRYNGDAMEVGPLASIVVGLAKKNPLVEEVANDFLTKTGLKVEHLFSTLGRTAARGLECKLVADHGLKAFDALINNLKTGDKETCAPYVIDKDKEYKGRYIGNVPRGMLSHWVRIKNGLIENYQCVVPSTWNAGPRDSKGQKGPYEMSLIGTKVADVTKPLEIVRHIHSFDPCIACAVHVMDTKGNEITKYKVDPSFARI